MQHGGAKQCNETLALAMEPSILVNSISMSWQRVCLALKSYVDDVDDQAIVCCPCQVMLAMVLLSHAGDGAIIMIWPRHDVDAESC
jgi:hypothetical protein